MCVYASNSLDFLSMPEQRKKIVLIISIIIFVFATSFFILADIRGECDRGGSRGIHGGERGCRRGPLRESMSKLSGSWKGGGIQTS